MKILFHSGLLIICFYTALLSQQITKIQTNTIHCDYLIISPDVFLNSAANLAIFRNRHQSNNISHAGVLPLSIIEQEFPQPDTVPRSFSIWYALHYALNEWATPPEYVVLLGDDSAHVEGFDTLSPPPVSVGLMPTVYYKAVQTMARKDSSIVDTSYEYSDFLYQTVRDTAPPLHKRKNTYSLSPNRELALPFAFGRIPARTVQDCEAYIEKLKRYERSNAYGAWYNRISLAADDAWQKDIRDHVFSLRPHQVSCDMITDSSFNGFFVNKTYLSSFPKDESGNHLQGKKHFFDMINKGSRFAVYFGHGHPDSLTDEGFLVAADTVRFENDSAYPMMFSFSCSNGEFLRKRDKQLCLSFLFKSNGGSIGYVAAPVETYAHSNQEFAHSIFSQLSSPKAVSLGAAIRNAQIKSTNINRFYQVLGDPAIDFSKKRLSASTELITNTNTDITITTTLENPTPMQYQWELRVRDSVVCLDTISPNYVDDTIISYHEDITSNGTVTAIIPITQIKANTHFVLYAWDEQSEMRIDTLIPEKLHIAHRSIMVHNQVTLQQKATMVHLSISNPELQNDVFIDLFSLDGTRVHRRIIHTTTTTVPIDLSALNLSKGYYIYRCTGDNIHLTGKIFLIE